MGDSKGPRDQCRITSMASPFEQYIFDENGAGEFAVYRTNNVPEFSFATVSESKSCDVFMSIRLDAAGVDGIFLSFIKLVLPVVLHVLIHIFNHIFVSSKFPGKWKTSVVLPIPKVSSPAIFFYYRPISLIVCLSKFLRC
jgi:hypothetical protein